MEHTISQLLVPVIRLKQETSFTKKGTHKLLILIPKIFPGFTRQTYLKKQMICHHIHRKILKKPLNKNPLIVLLEMIRFCMII